MLLLNSIERKYIAMNHVFIDSNLWLYLFFGDNHDKCQSIKNLLSTCNKKNIIVVSFQVLNEVAFNLKRKGFTEEIIRKIIKTLEETAVIIDFSTDILLHASNLRENHFFSYWDSLIVASAVAGKCKTLYSEDMQHNRNIEGLHIKNPFI